MLFYVDCGALEQYDTGCLSLFHIKLITHSKSAYEFVFFFPHSWCQLKMYIGEALQFLSTSLWLHLQFLIIVIVILFSLSVENIA